MFRFWRKKSTNRPRTGLDLRLPDVTYSPDTHITRHLFVCGLHRSGTTMLERYLHANYALSVLRADVPQSEGQFLQDVYPAAREFGGAGRFAFSAPMRAAMEALDDPVTCNTRIMEGWRRFLVGDAPMLLEKSPPNITKIAWLRRVFPGAIFLIFVRDPRAVAGATQKWSQTSLEELVMHWNAAHSIALDEMGEDCHVIRYEDFCVDPAKAVARSGVAEHLDPRANPIEIEARFDRFEDRNADYIARHNGTRYGRGAWTAFGYDI